MLVALRRRFGSGLAGDALQTTAVGIGIFGLSALTEPILARSLGTSARGDLAAVLVPTQLIGYVLLIGLPHSAAYFAREYPLRTLVMSSWVVAALLSLPVLVAGVLFAPRYLSGHAPITVGYFVAFLALWMCFSPVSSTLDALRGAGRITQYNVLRALPAVLNAVGLAVAGVAGVLDLRSALDISFVSFALGWAVTVVFARALPGRGLRREAFTKQVHYGVRAAIGTLAQTVVARLDQFLLVPIVSSEQLGLYVVAATGASLTSPLGQGIALALFPHLRASSEEEATRRTRQAMRWTLLLSGSMATVVGICAPWVIPALFGNDFRDSVRPLLILLPGQVLNDVATIQASKLEADGRPGAASQALTVAAVVTAIGLAVTVRPFGIVGAAAVTSIAQLTYLLTTSFLLHRGTTAAAREEDR